MRALVFFKRKRKTSAHAGLKERKPQAVSLSLLLALTICRWANRIREREDTAYRKKEKMELVLLKSTHFLLFFLSSSGLDVQRR